MNQNPDYTYRIRKIENDGWEVSVFFDKETDGRSYVVEYFRNDALPEWLHKKLSILLLVDDQTPFIDGIGKRVGNTFVITGDDTAKGNDLGYMYYCSNACPGMLKFTRTSIYGAASGSTNKIGFRKTR